MAGKAPTNDMAAPRSDVTSDMRAVGLSLWMSRPACTGSHALAPLLPFEHEGRGLDILVEGIRGVGKPALCIAAVV